MQDRIRIRSALLESARGDRGACHDTHKLAGHRPCTDSVAYETNCLTPGLVSSGRPGWRVRLRGRSRRSNGLHIAALAGSWIALVAGLAGVRDRDRTLSFAPRLPEELSRLALKICLRRRRLAVDVRTATATTPSSTVSRCPSLTTGSRSPRRSTTPSCVRSPQGQRRLRPRPNHRDVSRSGGVQRKARR